jgi:hypothetical protein
MNGQRWCRESRIATRMSIMQRFHAGTLPIGRRSLVEREYGLISRIGDARVLLTARQAQSGANPQQRACDNGGAPRYRPGAGTQCARHRHPLRPFALVGRGKNRSSSATADSHQVRWKLLELVLAPERGGESQCRRLSNWLTRQTENASSSLAGAAAPSMPPFCLASASVTLRARKPAYCSRPLTRAQPRFGLQPA